MNPNPAVLRETLQGSPLRPCATRDAHAQTLLPFARTDHERGRFRAAAAMVICVLVFMMSRHAAQGATLRMPPFLADDMLSSLAAFIGTGLVLLVAGFWLHALDQRSSIERLVAALERHSTEGVPQQLAEDGPPAIARLARAINCARRQNTARVAELLDILAAYAHDLRTPLTRMTLRCELIDDGALREAMERDLDEMGELVDASMACARMQCSVPEPLRHVDADGLLGTLVDNYRDAGRFVELEGQVGRPLVTCPHALRRVLANLIDNALRYGCDVRLCVRVDARRVILAVVDSGPGIVPAEMEAVFEPWYRAPQTSAHAPGSGLGLAIARRLTLAMRGDLQLENRHSGGLEARLTLPLVAA